MGFVFSFDFSFCFLIGVIGLFVALILLIIYLTRRLLDILTEGEWTLSEYQQSPQHTRFRQQTLYTRTMGRFLIFRRLGYGYRRGRFRRRGRRRGW